MSSSIKEEKRKKPSDNGSQDYGEVFKRKQGNQDPPPTHQESRVTEKGGIRKVVPLIL